MREPKKQLQNLYRYQPVEYHRVGRGIRPVNPEDENERCYELVHIKLAPRRLRMLSLFNSVILVGLLIALFAGSLLLPKPTESKVEKRALAQRPSFSIKGLLSGDFARDIEVYFSDTFPLREMFVSLSAVVDQSQGVRFDDVRVVGPGNDAQNMTAEPITSSIEQVSSVPQQSAPTSRPKDKEATISHIEATAPAPSPVDENATGTVSNGIFICQGRAMSLYGGSHESARRYTSVLNNYAKALPDVQIYNMIIPTASEFYMPQKYSSMTQSQKGVIDLIYSSLDPSIKKVNAYDALAAHTNEYLYFRTDHHWTGRGAYYAYTAFCQQAGFTPLTMEDFETRTLEDFIGTMYSQTQDSTLLNNPDYVDYYIFKQPYTAFRYDRGAPFTAIPHKLWGEYAKSPNSYSVFLQGDFPLIEVDTGIHNGRKIAVIKESFGNAFAPFLINHYEKVYIIDQRYFERPLIEFIKQQGINELVFANNSFAVCTPAQISSIENLKNAYVYTPPKTPVKPQEAADTAANSAEETTHDDIPKESSKPQKKTSSEKPVEKGILNEATSGLLKPRNRP